MKNRDTLKFAIKLPFNTIEGSLKSTNTKTSKRGLLSVSFVNGKYVITEKLKI